MRLSRQAATIAVVTLSGGKVRLKLRVVATPHTGVYSEIKRLLPEVEGARIAQTGPVEGAEKDGIAIDIPGARLGEARHAATLLWGEDDTALWAGPADLGRKAWVRFHPERDPVLLLTLELDGAPMTEVTVAQAVEWGGAEVLLSLDEAQQALPLEEAPPKSAPRDERTLPLALEETVAATEARGGIQGDFAEDFDGGYVPAEPEPAAEPEEAPPLVAAELPTMPAVDVSDMPGLFDAARARWLRTVTDGGHEVASTNMRAKPSSIVRTLHGTEFDELPLRPGDEPDLVIFWGVGAHMRGQPVQAADFGWRVLGKAVVDGVKAWRVVPLVWVPPAPSDAASGDAVRAKLRGLRAELRTDGRTGLDEYLAGLDAGQLVLLLRALTGETPAATSPTVLRSMVRGAVAE